MAKKSDWENEASGVVAALNTSYRICNEYARQLEVPGEDALRIEIDEAMGHSFDDASTLARSWAAMVPPSKSIPAKRLPTWAVFNDGIRRQVDALGTLVVGLRI